ncbi:hypothetical protein [Thalassotalea maritima]|uniref:hypothetical protein n=1 Tax=Thalassotalea maritima TaxID=3242416 RepID=UPI003527B0EC
MSQTYSQQLGFQLVQALVVSPQQAMFWQQPNLAGNRMHILAASNGHSWLRLVEDKHAPYDNALLRPGWMSLEINVRDVDAIAKRLTSGFEIISPPAYLQLSNAIKAMQVQGPMGEVLYLTQIDSPVPPFELPMTEADIGDLFIPVLATTNREHTLGFYQRLHDADQGLMFDTKITALSKARNNPLEHQYPVATLQLKGQTLLEIDEISDEQLSSLSDTRLPSGIAMVTIATEDIELLSEKLDRPIIDLDNHYQGHYCDNCRALFVQGTAGEWIEFIEARY